MKTIAVYLIMCLSCLSIRAQKCDSISLSKGSSLLDTINIEKSTQRSLSKNSKKRHTDNEFLKKYVDLDKTRNFDGNVKTNNIQREYRTGVKNNNRSYWTDLISNIIFR